MDVTISVIKSLNRVRSTTMRITNRGTVELRTPMFERPERLIEIISKNWKFLAKSLIIPKQVQLPGIVTTGEDIFIFGHHYLLEVLPAQKSSCLLNHEDRVISIKKRGRTISRKQLYEFLSVYLEEYIVIKAKELQTLMSQTERYKNIRLKLVRSQWGSCSRTGNLTFNRRLIHYPQDIIDYVIIHELAHLQQHNHAKVFWDIVEKYCPDFKIARKVLKSRKFG